MVRISNLELLKLLRNNARVTFVELAKHFKVSEAAIRKRVKKLENEGVIRKYTIEIDPKKLDFGVDAIIGIDTIPEDYVPSLEKLGKMKEVVNLYSSSGDHMILIESWFKNSEELIKFVKKLSRMKGVTKVCPAIIIEKIK